MEVLELFVIRVIPTDIVGDLIITEWNVRFRVVAHYSFVPSFDETKSSLILLDGVIGDSRREMIGIRSRVLLMYL